MYVMDCRPNRDGIAQKIEALLCSPDREAVRQAVEASLYATADADIVVEPDTARAEWIYDEAGESS